MRFEERLTLCTALQPAVCVRLLADECAKKSQAFEGLGVEIGGDDLPDAFRHVPVHPDDYRFNVVAVREPRRGDWRFQIMVGHLFGHACAVLDFNRYSKFLEAAGRRVLSLLVSMYYDDASIVDFSCAQGTGQASFNTLAACAGTPFAPEKKQKLASQADFLGLVHDFKSVCTGNVIVVTPRHRLVCDILEICRVAVSSDFWAPGVASKLLGKASFSATGLYGRVGRAALRPIIQRAYADASPWALSNTLRRALLYIDALFRRLPARGLLIRPPARQPVVIASDAQAELSLPSAGAILLGGPHAWRKLSLHSAMMSWSVGGTVQPQGGKEVIQ